MAVEFISSPITKICDQAGTQTYNPVPGIELDLNNKTTTTTTTKQTKKKNKQKKNKKKKQKQYREHYFTGQLHNDGMPFISYM